MACHYLLTVLSGDYPGEKVRVLNFSQNKTELFGIFSALGCRDTEVIEAKGAAHYITGASNTMNSQPNYRGLPFQTTAYKTIETQQEATFRGRKAKIFSPVKIPMPLPAEMQFFGRHASSVSVTETANLTLEGLMPA